jgi:DNA-binding beta-propeller fold protein YncE
VKSIVLLAFVLLCGTAAGQRVEKVIHLGDTWRLPATSVGFEFDSRDKTVFIGGYASDSILVLDERTMEPADWIDAGAGVFGLKYLQTLGKLYCIQDGAMTVYDASTHARLKTTAASFEPRQACLDSEDNKLYIINASCSLTVFDCSIDSVVAVLPGSSGPMCYVPGWRRIYFCDNSDSSVVVVDCRADTVIARIHPGLCVSALRYNGANGRVYGLCAGQFGPIGIDVSTNEVVSRGHCLWSKAMCCDPGRNRLYGVRGSSDVLVYDCSTDSVVVEMVTNGGVDMLAYNSAFDRIYAVSHYGGYLHIFDAAGDTMTERLSCIPKPYALGISSDGKLVFLAGFGDPQLMVVDGESDRLIRAVSHSYDFGLDLVDPGLGKVYCLTGAPAGLAVVDGQSGEVRRFTLTGRWPDGIFGDTVNHVVYLREEPSFITAVDGLADTVVNTIRLDCWGMPPVVLCSDTRDRKVYIGGLGSTLMVFDWSLRTMLDSFGVGDHVCALAYGTLRNRVHCGTEVGVTSVDCATDEVTHRIDLGCRVSQLCLGRADDRLYCVADTELVTINCSSAEVVGKAPTPHRGGELYYNPISDKVYRVCESSLCVYGGTDGHLLATIETGPLGRPAFDSRTNTVLCPTMEDSAILVVDCRNDRIATRLDIGVSSYCVATDGSMPFAFVCGGADIAVIRKDTVPPDLGVRAAPDLVGASVVHGRLYHTGGPSSVLLNAAGRKVLELRPDANEVGGLPAGVYFLRDEQARAVRKVIVTR